MKPLVSRARRALAAQAAGTGILVGLATLAPILAGLRYQGVDHSRILLGMQCAVRRGLEQGFALDLALGGGGPLLAELQSGVFYPATWLLLPYSAETAASLFVPLHLALAAAGAVLLAASFRVRPISRVALGVAYPLCGSVLNLILHGPFLAAAAWLPWAWAGARWALASRRWAAAGLTVTSAALALTLLSGDPQGFGIACAIVLLELTVSLVRRRRPLRAALAASSLVVGLLLGGIQWLPALGLREASARAKGASPEHVESWPLAAPELFGVLWQLDTTDRVRGNASLRTAWLGNALTQPAWNTTPLLGLAAFAAALAGFWLRRVRTAALAALLLTLMSLGAQTPFFPALLRALPFLGLFRYPARYFVGASLAILVVAVCSFDRAARHRSTRRALAIALGLATIASGAAMALVGVRAGDIDILASKVANAAGSASSSLPVLSSTLLDAGTLSTILCATALTVLLILPRWSALAVSLPLLAATPAFLPLDLALTEAPSARAAIGPPEQALLCHGKHLGSVHVDLPGQPLDVHGDVLPDFNDLLPNLQQCGGPAVPDWYLSSAQAETVALVRDRLDESVGALGPALALGCTHLVTRARTVQPGFVPLESVQPVPFVGYLYAVAEPMPAASIARAPTLASSGAEAVERVAGFSRADEVVRVLDAPGTAAPAALPDGRGVASAQVRWESPTRGQLQLEGQGGAVAVLKRPWWPGWRARQGGKELAILRAAAVQLAVVVPDAVAGPVSLEYSAPLLGWGVAASAFGALLLAAVGLLAWRSRSVQPL
ncbi:MAG: hypothetical protein QM765_45895 [Myxococcales bacterium]